MPETNRLSIQLPDWLAGTAKPGRLASHEQRMDWVLTLVRENIQRETGGPFAAAIFDEDSGELIAAACNQVVPAHCSIAHAEMLAIALAQQQLQTHDMGSTGKRCQLVSSAEPCAMCTGALPWAGLSSLVYGAARADVEAIGFDEGNKAENWLEHLQGLGIAVYGNVLQTRAAEILSQYQARDGTLY